jgi:hypothetical protein
MWVVGNRVPKKHGTSCRQRHPWPHSQCGKCNKERNAEDATHRNGGTLAEVTVGGVKVGTAPHRFGVPSPAKVNDGSFKVMQQASCQPHENKLQRIQP